MKEGGEVGNGRQTHRPCGPSRDNLTEVIRSTHRLFSTSTRLDPVCLDVGTVRPRSRSTSGTPRRTSILLLVHTRLRGSHGRKEKFGVDPSFTDGVFLRVVRHPHIHLRSKGTSIHSTVPHWTVWYCPASLPPRPGLEGPRRP